MKMKTILVLMTIVLALLAVFALVAAPIQRLSMNVASWHVTGWSATPSGAVPITESPYPTLNPATGIYFTFPEGTDRSINYMLQYRTKPISGSALSFTYQIVSTGTPTFNWYFPQLDPGNTCTATPAQVRFFFDRQDWYVAPAPETYRWWSKPIAAELQNNSTVTLTVPLTPDQWQSVYGKMGNFDAGTLADFQSSLKKPLEIGLSFGGGCFFGHGVSTLNGSAKFILSDYSIIP